ncbi:septum formation family protein [Micromonospora sp. NPDC049559]|uniref:septum formation family protein n=1 Tax=Micromonospora sp. NPDC049559 TaxID=3155923 RepID=UPI0034190F16
MRRWVTAATLGCVAVLALAGCGGPSGVDGDLTDDWPAVAQPVAFTPAAGTCHETADAESNLDDYAPVDCGQAHRTETFHLGTFTGADAARTNPPPPASPGRKAARAECDKQAEGWLAGDWRGGRLSVSVVPPTAAAWSGGARWFRCDVSEVGGLDDDEPVTRTGSLKGALANGSPLAYGCFNPKIVKDDVDQMVPVPCTSKHRAEFAGIYRAPDVTQAAFEKNSAQAHKGCSAVIAAFAKVPNNGELKYRTGLIYFYPGALQWADGNRGVQCFLWVDRDLTRSMKGAGTKGLPVT